MFQSTFVWIFKMFVLFYCFIFMIVLFVLIALTITLCANIVWWIFDYNSWNLKMLKFQSHFSIVFSLWLLSFYSNLFWCYSFRLKILKSSFQKHEKHIFQISLTNIIHLNIETSRVHVVHAFFRFWNKWKCRQNMQ